ncbi:MAG TPA: alkaline phosphatase family protein [Acidocella sp.]|jgi:arylsulfatase A-like enzyme|nr:alkaline phosphatase family protein [Acidocella sp.]
MVRRVVLVVLDGLRRDFLRPDLTPNLLALKSKATFFNGYRSTFPSTTRVVSATVATGCRPSRHGLQGNAMVLVEEGKLVLHDVGRPDYLQHKRSVTGCSLATPTLAERLAPFGGAILFNNVSPGAAYAHDPDGYGWAFHRAGSYGPGRVAVEDAKKLNVTLSIDGDLAMSERFLEEALTQGTYALSTIWLGEPDHIQHEVPMGSDEHLDVLRRVDACAGRLMAAVAALREAGQDILLLVGSDHGHQAVEDVIDIDAELVAAGLKESMTSGDVVVAPNGTAALIYVHPAHRGRIGAIADFLKPKAWCGETFMGADLATVGQSGANGLAIAISMKADNEVNAFGVPGRSFVVKPMDGKPDRRGCGQHGGLGDFEQLPFLMVEGEGFEAGCSYEGAVSAVDIAPTVLRHLRLPCSGMDGSPLQRVSNLD